MRYIYTLQKIHHWLQIEQENRNIFLNKVLIKVQ